MIIVVKSLQFLFKIVFFLPARLALFKMYTFAWLCHLIVRGLPIKKQIASNFKLVFPDLPNQQTAKLANNLIKNTCSTIMEVLCLPYFKAKHYAAVFKIQGLEHLQAARANNKGALLLTMHVGNYESAPNVLAHLGYKLNSILRADNSPIFELVNKSRGVGNINLINVVQENMYQETLKALSRNELVYLLVDTGALESRHEFYDFLGKKVPVATGWLTLAQRSETPVIPLLVKREASANVINIYPPLKITKDNRAATMRQVGKIFEDFIKQNPDQWGMFLNEYETKRMVGQ